MNDDSQRRTPLKRRDVLVLLGSTAAAIAAGCDSGSGTPGAGGAGSAGSAAGTGGAGGGTAAISWATGGTASMTGKASYPNPFASGPSSKCALTCEVMLGPCYSSQSVEIQDISYGYAGLPMRLYLQVLDESCKPVTGALIDVWHVSPVGKYSGNDPTNESVAFCTGNDSDFTSHLYFRGKQTTDASGVVFFDTCFPGWYSGRAIHIHLVISINDQKYLTTQLFFPDALDDELVGTQPLYKDRGPADTTNQTDGAISASAVADYEVQYSKMADGAMLAWKTLVLRSSLANPSCSAPAGMSGGMDGGMPPFGDGGMPPFGDGGPPSFGDGGPPDGG